MTRLRAALLILLLVLPLLIFLGVGMYAAYVAGYAFLLWLVWPACWLIAFGLARLWRTRLLTLGVSPEAIEPHWTERDQGAWELVKTRIEAAEGVPMEEFTQLNTYVDTAQEMATEVTRLYHPNAKDPVSSLTLPEILAAAELALEDLAELTDSYLPAGHLLTIKHWRRLAKVPKLYDRVAPWTWAASALFSPAATAGRYALSKTVLNPVLSTLQSNMLTWFYQRFIEKVGFYLIEMNSGRLKGGAKRFRATFKEQIKRANAEKIRSLASSPEEATPHPTGDGEPSNSDIEPLPEPMSVTIAIVGQVHSGKSSLIRALLEQAGGDRHRTETDAAGTVHSIPLPDSDTRLRLLDTRGFGGQSLSSSNLQTAEQAFSEADLVLLTMSASTPARQADAEFLDRLRAWFARNPSLSFPPVLGVLTHIDLLSPAMEWDPPYHWDEPSTTKEHSIHEAVAYTNEVLGERLVSLVPICTDVERGRVYGIDEWLLPLMLSQMQKAQAVALVRGLESDLKKERYRQVLSQAWNVGSQLVKAALPKGTSDRRPNES